MQYYLAEDVYSTFKKGERYGLKGSIVTLVTDAGNAAIVEDIKGIRFPLNKSKLILKSDKK